MALFTTTFQNVALTAQVDFFELVGASDSVAILHAVYLSQTTELGDTQEEGLLINIRRGNTTAGTGGSTVTPTPLETGSSAFGGTTAVNRTTKATAGTPVILHSEAWNVRSPYMYLPTPEMRPILGPSLRLCVELASTPADSITFSGTLYFEEIGG